MPYQEFHPLLVEARRTKDERGLAGAMAVLLKTSVDTVQRDVRSRFGLGVDIDEGSEIATWDSSAPVNAPWQDLRAAPARVGEVTTVLMDDPWDLAAVQQLTSYYGRRPQFKWSTLERIRRLQSASEGQLEIDHSSAHPTFAASLRVIGAAVEPNLRDITQSTVLSERSEVVRFVDRCLLDGWAAGASDLHFEMQRAGMDVKMRLDGVLVRLNAVDDIETAGQVINRIKVLAQLDISETRIPQDGRFRCAINGRGLDFRVSIMPSVFGEDAVVRLLDKAQLRKSEQGIALADLGFAEDALEAIRRLSSEPHGMLLVTGPTGSGKTTTLYALLSEIRSGEEKVVTIEDPVEYELPGVLQIPVNEKKGLTFAKGLRSILRHDPDRILVGEIRDEETASIAVQAALTGHLVYSTVHANSVYDLVGRFVHMGVDLYGFASALNGVVSQRLLRKVCQACAQETQVELVESDVGLLESFSRRPFKFRRGAGCTACRGTGYRGRIAVADVLPFDDQLRELITERVPVRAMREYVASLQIVTVRQRALSMVAVGATTLEEVRRVVGSSD